jgi:hypothetical protein
MCSENAQGMTAFAEPLVHDELEAVVSELCARFPNHPRREIEAIVTRVYATLNEGATVTAHLIPLTLNRSRRLMEISPATGHSAETPSGQPVDRAGTAGVQRSPQ